MRTTIRDAGLVVVAIAVELVVWSGADQTRWGRQLPPLLIPVLTSGAFVTLLHRWRRPMIIFAVQVGYALAAELVVPDYQSFMGVLIGLHAVARRGSVPTSVLALGTATTVFGLSAVNSAPGPVASTSTVALMIFLWTVVAGAVWGWARLTLLGERRAEVLRARAAAEAGVQAVRAERLRLARELHDTVTNAVSAVMLQAAGARAAEAGRPGTAPSSIALRNIETLGTTAMTELHRMLGILRASAEAEGAAAAGDPGLDDLPRLVELARLVGVEATLTVRGPATPLGADVELVLYRAVQESLTNVWKHAGPGSRAEVDLVRTARRCVLTVTDTRPERPAAVAVTRSGGFGLAGLAERLTPLGGVLTTASTASGFRLRLVLPLDVDGGAGVTPARSSHRPRLATARSAPRSA